MDLESRRKKEAGAWISKNPGGMWLKGGESDAHKAWRELPPEERAIVGFETFWSHAPLNDRRAKLGLEPVTAETVAERMKEMGARLVPLQPSAPREKPQPKVGL